MHTTATVLLIRGACLVGTAEPARLGTAPVHALRPGTRRLGIHGRREVLLVEGAVGLGGGAVHFVRAAEPVLLSTAARGALCSLARRLLLPAEEHVAVDVWAALAVADCGE